MHFSASAQASCRACPHSNNQNTTHATHKGLSNHPLSILDVGGTVTFATTHPFTAAGNVSNSSKPPKSFILCEPSSSNSNSASNCQSLANLPCCQLLQLVHELRTATSSSLSNLFSIARALFEYPRSFSLLCQSTSRFSPWHLRKQLVSATRPFVQSPLSFVTVRRQTVVVLASIMNCLCRDL